MPVKTKKQTPLPLLGGLSADAFCATVWHQKPLLIRQAIPEIKPLLEREDLFELAQQEHVESRLITAFAGKWQMKHGPFASLPARSKAGWTLLIQSANLHSEAVHALMERFTFIERARLDDVMISFASDGGGVGAHFDSYDVFLLQVQGQRRWRVSTQKDLSLVDGLPLKILKNFKPTQEWVLEPGDMLYLPPHVAHEGVAVGGKNGGDCMTYSIGFRAAGHQEVMSALLDDMQDILDLQGRFSNHQPVAATPTSAAQLPTDLLDQLEHLVKSQWPNRAALTDFLGRALTEPKDERVFTPTHGSAKHGIALARATRALTAPGWFFINGESWKMGGDDARRLTQLAQQRSLNATSVQAASSALKSLINEWREMGWIVPVRTPQKSQKASSR